MLCLYKWSSTKTTVLEHSASYPCNVLFIHFLVFILKAKFKVEKKFREHHLAIAQRHRNTQTAHIDRIAQELGHSLQKLIAYKQVVARKSFSVIEDKEEKLNTNYSAYALRFDIAEEMRKLDPATIREEQAAMKVEKARQDCNSVISRNLRTILSPRTRYRKKLRQQLNLERDDSLFSMTPSTGKPASRRLSPQKSMGLLVTKSFIQNERMKTKSRLGSTVDEVKLEQSLKLPPIAKTEDKKDSKRAESHQPKKPPAPLPEIQISKSQTKKANKGAKPNTEKLVFNSQKAALPSIKVT